MDVGEEDVPLTPHFPRRPDVSCAGLKAAAHPTRIGSSDDTLDKLDLCDLLSSYLSPESPPSRTLSGTDLSSSP